MGYKPQTSRYKASVKYDATDTVAYYDWLRKAKDGEKEKKQIIKNDSNKRLKIHDRIRELKFKGFPQEEALARLHSEFPNSEYKGFFKSWIENVYKEKPKKNLNKIIFGEGR